MTCSTGLCILPLVLLAALPFRRTPRLVVSYQQAADWCRAALKEAPARSRCASPGLDSELATSTTSVGHDDSTSSLTSSPSAAARRPRDSVTPTPPIRRPPSTTAGSGRETAAEPVSSVAKPSVRRIDAGHVGCGTCAHCLLIPGTAAGRPCESCTCLAER